MFASLRALAGGSILPRFLAFSCSTPCSQQSSAMLLQELPFSQPMLAGAELQTFTDSPLGSLKSSLLFVAEFQHLQASLSGDGECTRNELC